MKRQNTLVLPHKLAEALRLHLFPGDGLEAAALLVCARVGDRRTKLLAREFLPVPYELCQRRADFLTWPGEYVERAIDVVGADPGSIIAIHSHPGGLFAFSEADNKSDEVLMPALWQGSDALCGSAIMVPSGAVRARVYHQGARVSPVELVLAAGPDLVAWWDGDARLGRPSATVLPFSGGMRERLSRLSVCVIGVSGTGSIVAEQLARLGVGEIILIDYDKLEERNFNRILNSNVSDLGRLKVEMFADAIRKYRPDCDVIAVPSEIGELRAIEAACEADILFSCVDTAEGRHIADRLSAYFAMPLFDVGVAIPTETTSNGGRKISEVYGRVDYVFPGGSSLLDRGVYDGRALEAEYLARHAPNALARKIADGYLQGAAEQAPAVISVNMRAASACVIEFIARLFPFRQFSNEHRARSIFTLGEGEEDTFAESDLVASNRFAIARGFSEPLLGLPALSKPRRVA